MNIIFLDIDGVLNCQMFYTEQQKSGATYIENNFCKDRIIWLNELCKEMDIKVVISSSWRIGRTVKELKEIFIEAGATFDVIDTTPHLRHEGCVRGNEIYQWIQKGESFTGCAGHEFNTYVIIDDDSDMLLWQREHFFQTDNYSGLTPTTCYKIKRFFEKFKPTQP